jgi:hypothetical protein
MRLTETVLASQIRKHFHIWRFLGPVLSGICSTVEQTDIAEADEMGSHIQDVGRLYS